MQAAETVYEFGSSPDEDDDISNTGQSSSSNTPQSKSSKNKSTSSRQKGQPQHNQPTSIAGTNLRPNKTSSTSINQKLNTSFSSISDNHPSPNLKASNTSSSANPIGGSGSGSGNINDISASDEQLLLNEAKQLIQSSQIKSATTGGGGVGRGSPNQIVGSSISNTSNTSLTSGATSNTSGSRGNVSQSVASQSLSQKLVAASSVSASSQQQQNNPNFDSNVISERVKNLATQIYQELKRIISRCNYDEDILSGLMPLIVRVLESLDLALIENQQLQVELELCKDDNEQLVIMFEKEKAAKRAIDKKLIESEYAYEEERQQYQQRIESLDSTVKMFELKTKNASDQATRFEEKEAERKKEYNKLHDRYTELLKSHCDVVERVRHLVGNAEVANLSSINVPQQMVASSSDLTVSDLQAHHLKNIKLKSDETDADKGVLTRTRDTQLKSWNAETELTLEDASLVVIEDILEAPHASKTVGDASSHNESERTTSEVGEGEHEKESENDSIAYTSMEKEFRKLIQENKDLLNTKNALNVVKDDLIAEVDRLTNEVSMYEQAVEQLNLVRDQMKQKVSSVDAELRKTKEELEKAKQKIRENNEEGVPYSQRKRFGRAEMAKVLMERNNYKERYMELQDAVRYTELVRANKVETEKRSGLWKFFSNLFGAPLPREALAIGAGGGQTLSRNSSPVVSYHGSPAVGLVSADQQAVGSLASVGLNQLVTSDALQSGTIRGSSIRSINQRLSSNSDLIVLMDSDLNIDRSRASKEVGGRFGSDMSGYIQAYGWSLPASSIKALTGGSNSGVSAIQTAPSPSTDLNGGLNNTISGGTSSSYVISDPLTQGSDYSVGFNKLSGLQVPIPQYCRPLSGDSLGMKIWCATTIDLSGGQEATVSATIPARQLEQEPLNQSLESRASRDPDSSGSIVNISTSTPIKLHDQQALRELEQEVSQALSGDGVGQVSNSPGQSPQKASHPDNLLSSSRRPILKTTTEMVLSALPIVNDSEDLSTCVWICSTQHSRSKITIIDMKTKPNELLDSFYVPTFLYCIKSIPGAKGSDLLGISQKQDIQSSPNTSQNSPKSSITLGMLKELIATQRKEFYKLIEVDMEAENKLRLGTMGQRKSSGGTTGETKDDSASQFEMSLEQETQASLAKPTQVGEDDAEISRILDNNVSVGMATLQKLNDFVAHTQPQSEASDYDHSVKSSPNKSPARVAIAEQPTGDRIGSQEVTYYQPISTYLSTVWMGGKDSILYVHSAIGQWKDCVACVKLSDSILQICHFRGKVFVALADGTLCVFFRNVDSKQWEFSHYLLIDINLMADVTSDTSDMTDTSSIDLLSKTSPSDQSAKLASSPTNLSEQLREATSSQPQLKTTPNKPNTSHKVKSKVAGIRCLEIANKNLWVGYRNRVLIIDPITLKLKHTFSVVPQVDNQIRQLISMRDGVFCCLRSDLILRLYSSLKPYQHIQNIDIEPIVTRLISPKTFVISHITAMKVADNTLWIGNAHGIILTIPCKLVPQISEAPISSRSGEIEELSSSLSIARFVPKCDITNAQISFHGHRDAVKFFVNAHNLMLSGGQGYLDFRLDMDDQSKSISDKSHLILWQLP